VQAKVAVNDGRDFGQAGHVRLNFGKAGIRFSLIEIMYGA
jgi:bifunctional pyridoxal-dependent enzyme with beta-cystathionase and maltose regulon repressor activities